MVHSKSETLFESMCKCRIRIPLKILLLLDQKILKIEPEMAELALSLSRVSRFSLWSGQILSTSFVRR